LFVPVYKKYSNERDGTFSTSQNETNVRRPTIELTGDDSSLYLGCHRAAFFNIRANEGLL
ncbi:hypothetical protein, partial [Paenibacillus terrigena]|uniref:hypothetical protein n=1 Tax=Paenibacillus terrigena TaxID=369333 RepID=UPI0028D2B59A